ncbi:MAG: hypothetical protein D6725_01330 [Planctomycetota bacterium]|nr:MAG: hypothetical protein D6725_01330 [Planctomycetota bacterium]
MTRAKTNRRRSRHWQCWRLRPASGAGRMCALRLIENACPIGDTAGSATVSAAGMERAARQLGAIEAVFCFSIAACRPRCADCDRSRDVRRWLLEDCPRLRRRSPGCGAAEPVFQDLPRCAI